MSLEWGSPMRNAAVALGVAAAMLAARGQQPLIPPSLSSVTPAGLERGTTTTFTIEGRNLSNASEAIFDGPGIHARVLAITDVPEKITGPRAGEDLEAQVPVGKKQTARIEVTAANDAAPGIHRFRVRTPLGTTNAMPLAVGMLPEVRQPEKRAMDGPPFQVTLPATLVGTIAAPGDADRFEFEGKAQEDLVFQVEASTLGSSLISELTLADSAGTTLATAGKDDDRADAVLIYHVASDGRYTLSIADRDRSGGMNHFYRVNAGALPYITQAFPLGARAGESAKIAVDGVNLGAVREVSFEPKREAGGWTTAALAMNGITPLNDVKLAIGDEPEIMEREPNDSADQAQPISLPVTVNGHIDGGLKSAGKPDEDYFRFHAARGQRLDIDVAAARLGSQLDSVIEVLDAHGNPIPRATVRCLNQTTTTLADRDSRTTGIRLVSTAELREGDYLMVGDELNRIAYVPDQPDADTELKGRDGSRIAYLGTSGDVHAVNTPVYKVQILPPGTETPPNGLPVFQLTWRNDDGGPGYGPDSALDFVAPADGDYLLHLRDVRGLDGPDFAYRLTIRPAVPDYQLKAEPANPNIPRGGATPVTVRVIATRNDVGPIRVEAEGLPPGVTAAPAAIQPGQDSGVVVLIAAADAPLDPHPAPIRFVGHEDVDGHDLVRVANVRGGVEQPLQLASITPPPDVVVTTEAHAVSIEPGKEATVTLHIDRRNGFKGRVPCTVDNLPPGVRVVNVGLNGVLVTEAQTTRTFTLRAEEWAQPVRQPIYVVAMVESNSPTLHPSEPLMLEVAGTAQRASAPTEHASKNAPPNR